MRYEYLTPEVIRKKDRPYSIFLIVVFILSAMIFAEFYFDNPGMESLEREVHKTGENPAIFITGPVYILGSIANGLIAFFFGAVPAVISAVSFVFEKLAVRLGIGRDGSVHTAAYHILRGLSIFIISAYFIVMLVIIISAM